jgi:ParB family chromosome partitioning protein
MSKADQLGESASFSAAKAPRSERRRLIDGAVHEAHEEATPPAQTEVPRTVKLTNLAPNPFNPRNELGNLNETADSLLERGQVQPITVITRQAFLEAHPGTEEEIGAAPYVVLDGNRRLAAARLAGLDDLRVDVNDALAATAADTLESALIANIHREDLTPLEEAQTLTELLEVHGSQRNVARRLGKSHVWVSQRLALLELTPKLQKDLADGELTVEEGRRIGKLPKARQGEAAEQAKAERSARGPKARSLRSASASSEAAADGGGGNGVNARAKTGAEVLAVDWDDPAAIAEVLKQRLNPDQLRILADLLSRER